MNTIQNLQPAKFEMLSLMAEASKQRIQAAVSMPCTGNITPI